MRCVKVWEVKWEHAGEEVEETAWLWVIARNAREAAAKAARFLRRKYRRTRIVGVSDHGTIDVF